MGARASDAEASAGVGCLEKRHKVYRVVVVVVALALSGERENPSPALYKAPLMKTRWSDRSYKAHRSQAPLHPHPHTPSLSLNSVIKALWARHHSMVLGWNWGFSFHAFI